MTDICENGMCDAGEYLSCDNVCDQLYFRGWHKEPDGLCPKPKMFNVNSLIDILKHCEVCCPTVAQVVAGAGGGLCVRVNTNNPVVVRCRDWTITEGSGEFEGNTSTPNYMKFQVKNPFTVPSLVEITVNCKLASDVNTKLSGVFLVSDKLNESRPIYFDTDNFGYYGGGVEPVALDFHTSTNTAILNLNPTVDLSNPVIWDLVAPMVGGATMTYKDTLQPGESKMYYAQAWAKAQPIVEPYIYFHTAMAATANVFRGVI